MHELPPVVTDMRDRYMGSLAVALSSQQSDVPTETLATKMTRSEVLASEENIARLDQRIKDIRYKIFTEGTPLTQIPQFYDQWSTKSPIDQTRASQQFWLARDGVWSGADLDFLGDVFPPPIKLQIGLDDPSAHANVVFKFNNTFNFVITFNAEDHSRGVNYQIGNMPLDQMTEEEYTITDHLLTLAAV